MSASSARCRLPVFLEEDKGSDHHVFCGIGIGVRGRVDTGRMTSTTTAPFAVRATTCDDAPFVFRASLPVKSPNSLLRCGDSNRLRVPRGGLWSWAEPFVPPSPARAGCVIGSRGDHSRDRNVAIDRISYGTIQTCEFRRWGLSR